MRQFKGYMQKWLARFSRAKTANQRGQPVTRKMKNAQQRGKTKRPRRSEETTTPAAATAHAAIVPVETEESRQARVRHVWLTRTLRQHMRRQLAPDLRRAGMVIQEAAASAASYCLSKGRTTAGVDEHVIHLLNRLHNDHIIAATNARNRQFRFPQERGRRRRQQAVIRPSPQPQMKILRTIERSEIEKWRLELANLIAQARQYRSRHDPNYRIDIRRWVDENVWAHISIRLLHREDRTTRGQKANDAAVARYLLRLRQYANQRREPESTSMAASTSNRNQRPTLSPAATVQQSMTESDMVQRLITEAYEDGMFGFRRSGQHDDDNSNDHL